jgi:hypothetical protein
MPSKGEHMSDSKVRGSAKLLAAWKTRSLSEESFREITEAFDKSPATVEQAHVVGGHNPTGVQMTLSYEGDDGPWCGNDLQFWVRWHRKHGGVPRPPRILINGIPFPDLVRMELSFGQTAPVPGLDGADHIPLPTIGVQ